MAGIAETYRRLPPVLRSLPWLILIPFAAELAQHVAEVRLGMYAPGGLSETAAAPVRLAFGLVKVVAILLTLLFLLRWWAFDGDARRAARPDAAFWRGFAIFVLVQIGGETALLLAARGVIALVGSAVSPGVPIALQAAALVLWLLIATLLIPWFVALLTGDRTMTLRRSIRSTTGHLVGSFGVLLAAILPLMIVHYALGHGVIGQPPAMMWVLLLLDAAVVAALSVAIASAYFTLYRLARAR